MRNDHATGVIQKGNRAAALARVAQSVGALACRLKGPGSIPGQGTGLGCGFSPWLGVHV